MYMHVVPESGNFPFPVMCDARKAFGGLLCDSILPYEKFAVLEFKVSNTK